MPPPLPGLRLGLAPRLLLLLGGSSEGFFPPFSVFAASSPSLAANGATSRLRQPPAMASLGLARRLRFASPDQQKRRGVPAAAAPHRQGGGGWGKTQARTKWRRRLLKSSAGDWCPHKGDAGSPARPPAAAPTPRAGAANENAPPEPSATHLEGRGSGRDRRARRLIGGRDLRRASAEGAERGGGGGSPVTDAARSQ